MKWRIWHEDKDDSITISTFDEWKALDDGIIGIVEYLDDTYRTIITGTDWYIWSEGSIIGGIGGMPDTWSPRPTGYCSECVKRSAPTLNDDLWALKYDEMWRAEWP